MVATTSMTYWLVRVEYAHHVDQDDAPTLGEQLAQKGAETVVIDTHRGRVRINIPTQARTLLRAVDQAVRAADHAAAAAGITTRPVRVEALTAEDVEEELRRPVIPDLVGTTEAAAILRISYAQASELLRKHPLAPRPALTLSRGALYTRDSITAFDQRWERRRTGRPPR